MRQVLHYLSAALVTMVMVLSGAALLLATNADAACHHKHHHKHAAKSATYRDGWLDGVTEEAATHEVPPSNPGTGPKDVVAYNRGWIAGETAYRALYSRKAESKRNPDGSVISNPAGPVLARECTSQYTSYDELHPCLTQPHI